MDRRAYVEKILAYGELLESNDFNEAAVQAVFTEDGEAVLPHVGSAKGIRELAEKHTAMMSSFTGATHNITNVVLKELEGGAVEARWHMEVIHQFLPPIAEHTPGDLFICNDRVTAVLRKTEAGPKIERVAMDTVYKRFAVSARD